MQKRIFASGGLLLGATAFFLFFPGFARAQAQIQAINSRPRITSAIDEVRLTTLRGNTHPLAKPQFDQGSAPPSLPVRRMLLVLTRSSEQQSTLETLLEQQQDASSPNFHAWLTPQQFGQQFGPNDQDIQTITFWLQAHGFQVAGVSSGRTVIEFSGTAAEVQEAFHTSIHRFTVNGTDYWANSSDPQIPTALTPVVAGINTLYNFPRRQMHELFHSPSSAAVKGVFPLIAPQYTFPNPCSTLAQRDCIFGVAPADFAKIYSVPNLLLSPAPPTQFNGDGVIIAVVGESDINTNDIAQFRSMFGLPAPRVNTIVNGPDPGTVEGAETEADLDVEWSGAVAPNATIDFVIAEQTEVSLGADLAAQYAVDNNLAPVLNESFGVCEYFMGTADNTFYNQLWQQAAAQGITVTVAAGDGGSALCDRNAETQGPAQYGISVSGTASTPYNIAVGGTDFGDAADPTSFWSSSNNSTTLASALGYIPETSWNNTCTNQETFSFFQTTTAEQTCNNAKAKANGLVIIAGGSGGKSACTTSDFNITTGTGNVSSCAGGYAKPAWQTALTPQDGSRDLPDVSMFASNGFNGSLYVICEADIPADQSLGTCGNSQLTGIGGTSASAPSFAGIMALVNQATGSRQGNANYILYKMAAQAGNTCISAANPASSCIFYDIRSGSTIAMPCASGSPNCTISTTGDTVGVLSANGAPAYNTATGYDLATGLGSVNAGNLVTKWKNFSLAQSSTTLSLNSGATINIRHGLPVNVNIDVTGSSGTPNGNVSLIANTGPRGTEGVQGFVLSDGSVSAITNSLPGGNYTVVAQYAGDGTFGSSTSSPPIPVTVTPEASKLGIAYELFIPTNGQLTNPNGTTVVFGTPSLLRVNVTSQAGDACASNAPGNTGCPTGSVTLTDSYNGASATQLDGGSFPLNTEGYTEDQTIDLPGGTHNITAAYSGDNSYTAAASTSETITITQAPTTTTFTTNIASGTVGELVTLNAFIYAQNISSVIGPTGTVTFFSGSTPVATAPVSGSVIGTQANAIVTATTTALPHGQDSITAQYSGDASYAASTSPPTSITLYYPTATTLNSSNSSIPYGASVTFSAQVATSQIGGPAITGTVLFAANSVALLGAAVPLSNGQAQLTTSSLPSGMNTITAEYQGDTNYGISVGSTQETVGPAPTFTISANPTTVNILAPGQAGTTTLTFTAQNGFSSNGPVTIKPACAGLPSETSCSSGASVTIPVNGTATALVTFTTTAASSVVPDWHGRPDIFGKWTTLEVVTLASLCWFSIFALSSARRQRRWVAGAVVVACVLVAAIAGCGGGGGSSGGGGGGNPGTPAGTTLPAVSVTIGGVTQSVNITLTVQ